MTASDQELTVAEGESVTYSMVLSFQPAGDVTIAIGGVTDTDLTLNNTNLTFTISNWNTDYSGVPSSLTFDSGDTEMNFTFEAAPDNLEDSGESVKLGFGTLPTGVSAGTKNETTVSIDNVSAQNSLRINFGASGYGLTEGGTAVITVTLSVAPGSEVTIPLIKTEQGGVTSADYSGVPDSLTFGGSDTSKTFTFTAIEDTIDDDDESVKLGFGTLPAGVSAGTTSEATVSITDDDHPANVDVSFQSATYTVAEGNSVTVKVTLSADPERSVTIPLTKADQGGASNSDYSGVPGNVVFNSGDTEKTFSFSAASDSDNDDGESVKLGFGNLPTGVSAGSTDEATVSITDDDAQIFDPDATYRVLTFYGSNTEIDLAGYLADGVTGITFTLESCDSARSDYYDSEAVTGGKLTLTSNTLGHIHGTNTQTETTCTVMGAGSVGSQEQEFELYTVSDRTPPPLLPGDLSLVEARTNELDVQVSVPEGSIQYVRLGWRKVGGGAPTFRVVSGVAEDTVLTIPGLDIGATTRSART